MLNQKFERLLAGAQETLSASELLQFESLCSSRSLPLQKWIELSLQLYALNPDHCYQFLNYLDRQQMSKPIYNDFIHQASKITVYNNLTGLALARASHESTKQDHEKWMNEARRYLNSSEKVRMTVDKSIILNRAFLHYYGGEVTKALSFVNRTYEEVNKTGEGRHLLTTTTIMLAQIHFIKKNYPKALELYKKCLETSKSLPIKGRLGMAYSFYYLGKYELARACFQRIIKLDPSCTEAYVGIAVVYDKEENYMEYFKHISAAYKVNRQHPLVLIHLAEHFLLRGDLLRSEQYCQQGLLAVQKYPKFLKVEQFCRNDYEQLKARFNNILAQINHISSNYADAIKYYNLASGKGLLYNDVGLAQAYINPNSQNYIEAIRILDEIYKQLEGKDGRLLNDSYKLMAYLKSKIPAKSKEERGTQYYYSQALKYNKQDYESKIQYANLLVETNKQKALKQLEEVEKILHNNGNGVKPELQNNIAVLELQNGEPQKSEKRLIKCIKLINETEYDTEQDEIRKGSLLIISKFNYGICLQKQSRWNEARLVYQQILTNNKYHLDSYLRLAYIWYQLGNYSEIMRVFSEIQAICTENKFKLLRADKLYNLKAYLQHLSGNTSQAKETIKLLGKHKDIYTQVFELCMNYESIMRKGVDLSILKEFLRPNRQFCYKYCNQDHNATFAYMLLAIILLSDKKINKAQGLEYFSNLKQFSSDQIPSILYNMGLFLMNYDDSESSNAALALYKDKVGSNCKGDEITALNHLLENQFPKSESYIKRNIMRDPSNLKYRLQLAYATERRCHKYYELGDFTKKIVQTNICNLKSCMTFYAHLGKIAVFDQIRGIEVPELKERIRNIYLKIKGCGEERKFYIKSYLDSYEKIQREVDLKERQKQEIERLTQQKLMTQQKQKELQQLLQEEEDSEDEEEKQRREREKKRQRALQFARKRQEEMDANWNDLLEKDKANYDDKKARKRGPNVNPKAPTPKIKKNKHKQKESDSFEELPQRSQQPSASEPDDEPEVSQSSQPRKKTKHEKKEKKEKKRRHRSSSEDGAGSESKEQKPPSKKDDDEDEELLKYRC